MEVRKNKNRGYQQLRVWQDAVDLYRERGDWIDNLMVKESNDAYSVE